MKTMKQLQNEQLSKCRFDGGWPRPFIGMLGIVQVAHNQEEHDKMFKREIAILIIGAIWAIVLVSMLALFL